MIIQVVISLVILCDSIGLVERHMTFRPYADVDFNEEAEGDNKVSSILDTLISLPDLPTLPNLPISRLTSLALAPSAICQITQ